MSRFWFTTCAMVGNAGQAVSRPIMIWVACTTANDCGINWFWTPSRYHICVHDPDATWVWIDLSGSIPYWGLCRCPEYGMTPEDILMSAGHGAACAIHTDVDCALTLDHGDIQPQVVAHDHMWVCGFSEAGVCVDVHCPCYYRGLWEPCVEPYVQPCIDLEGTCWFGPTPTGLDWLSPFPTYRRADPDHP